MSITTLAADICSQMVEFTTDGLDLIMDPAFRQDGRLEPVVNIVGQHLQQEEKLVTLLVSLTVLVKSKAILEFIDLVLDIAALVVLVEDLYRGQIVDIGHNKLVFIRIDHRHLDLLVVFDRSGFSDQDEPIGLFPLGELGPDLID